MGPNQSALLRPGPHGPTPAVLRPCWPGKGAPALLPDASLFSAGLRQQVLPRLNLLALAAFAVCLESVLLNFSELLSADPRGLGSGQVNGDFGWKPLVSLPLYLLISTTMMQK